MWHFPKFWLNSIRVWWPRLLKNLIIFLDNKFALSVNVMMWLTPMWQDRSLLGRILSLIVRTIRIVIGVTIISITMAAAVIWFLAWILLTPALLLLWPIDVVRQLIDGRQDLGPQIKKLLKRSPATEIFRQQLLKTKAAASFLARLEIAPETFSGLILPLTVNDWLIQAGKETSLPLEAEDLILAILNLNQWRYYLGQTTYSWLKKMTGWARTPFLWDKDYVIRPIGGVDRGQIGVTTPLLNRFSRDLTSQAQRHQLPEIIGKEKAVNQLVKILSRKDKHHVLVIGEPGSGKTTLIKGLAQEIIRGVSATALRFKRLVSLDPNRLAAGADEARLGQRIEQIIDEIRAAQNIILFVDEVHQLPDVLFRALEPALDEGSLQFIGATNTSNYKKFIAPKGAFSRLFEIVELPEASRETTEELLEYLAWQREHKEAVIFSRLALGRIIELSDRYFHDRVMPDKAVNLLDEAVAQAVTAGNKLITSFTIDQLVTEKTKVPVSQVSRDEAKILLHLETKLHQRVIGQETALKAVAAAIRRARTQLVNPNKPIASFLFAGPTGVGKTETAKALSAEFFGSEKVMIRLDMSEYQTVESVDRLLTILTDAVRQQPYTLLLLDEIEKAHEKVINLFLQVLDDARLTDLSGKTADFSNTIIIATTNAKDIKKAFAPEWLNRFSSLITFSKLTTGQIEQVVKLKLEALRKNLNKQEIKIEFGTSVVKTLAREAFSDEWGGRQADRVIQNRVESVIAEKILQGEIIKNKTYRFSL